jgi:hypothetical protein
VPVARQSRAAATRPAARQRDRVEPREVNAKARFPAPAALVWPAAK